MLATVTHPVAGKPGSYVGVGGDGGRSRGLRQPANRARAPASSSPSAPAITSSNASPTLAVRPGTQICTNSDTTANAVMAISSRRRDHAGKASAACRIRGQRDFSFESRRKAGRHGNPYGTEPFKIMRPDPFDLTPGWQPTAGRGHALDAP